MSSIFTPNPGPLSFGWAPNHFILGAQLATGEKMLVCIPAVLSVCDGKNHGLDRTAQVAQAVRVSN